MRAPSAPRFPLFDQGLSGSDRIKPYVPYVLLGLGLFALIRSESGGQSRASLSRKAPARGKRSTPASKTRKTR